jgi:predicted dehydrogenase
MTDAARVGVIGCGWWSTFAHLPALHRNPAATIAAVADPNDANRASAAEAFNVSATFETPEQLLGETPLDAVVVAVPPAHHYGCARLALERGIHVLLEKPMVLNLEQGRSLVAIAKDNEAELIIGYPWHYNQHVLKLRELVASGVVGEVEHVSCLYASVVRELYRGNPEPYRDVLQYTINAPMPTTYSDPRIAGGGQGTNQVTHAAALLMWLTGLAPERVAAFTERFELPVDLMDAVAIQFTGGAVGSLSSTGSVIPAHEEILEYRIFGRSGHILLDLIQGTATLFTTDDRTDLDALRVELRYPHWAPADNLVQLALGAGTNGSPPDVGLATVAFLDALYRSAATDGNAIAVEKT